MIVQSQPLGIDPLTEQLVSLTEAVQLLPRRPNGKRPHISLMYRWTTAGVRGVVLESIQAGGTRCTSREALSRFFQKLTAASGHSSSVPPAPANSKCRQRSIAQAEATLDAAGI